MYMRSTTELFSDKFAQFWCLEPILQFVINLHKIKFDKLE